MTDTVGQRITATRGMYRINQAQLGERLGITRAAISLYEQGRVSPSAKVLDRLAKVFNCDPEWFGYGRGKAPDAPLVTIDALDAPLVTIDAPRLPRRLRSIYARLVGFDAHPSEVPLAVLYGGVLRPSPIADLDAMRRAVARLITDLNKILAAHGETVIPGRREGTFILYRRPPMTEPPPLPRSYISDGAGLRCPWCRTYDIAQAAVPLEALQQAHEGDMLRKPKRGQAGDAPVSALTIDCPRCGHPSMISLVADAGWQPAIKLTPVRTAADLAYLQGASNQIDPH
jgi:transcriptional regulator with XRE-family HTH domain